jgi:Ca2+-binding RTX toxin-like protein
MTVYYVDATSGSDSNTGKGADSAWQSVAKVNSIKFQPGDEILFKTGDTYHEALIPRSSGTADNPITFGSYGDGPAPVFEGSYDLSQAQWTESSPGSNVWTASFTPRDGMAPDAVYCDNTPLGLKVAGCGDVCNSGQWSYSDGKLTIWSDNDPSDGSVEAQTESRLLKILGVNHVTVENLHFTQAGEGVAVYNTIGVKLINLEVDHNYTNGLEISKSTGLVVEGGEYHDNGRITQWYNSGHGIMINKDSWGNVVDGVASYGNAEDGVQFFADAGNGNVIRNSTLYGNNEDGIDIKKGSQTIEDSVIYGNKQEGINVHDWAGITYIFDNIVSGLRHGMDVSEWASVVSSGNIYEGIAKNAVKIWSLYGNTSSFSNDIFTTGNSSNPIFLNQSSVAHILHDVLQLPGYDWRAALLGSAQGTPQADELTLSGSTQSIDLGDGNDCLSVSSEGLAGLQALHGGNGTDQLCLTGGGTFDLNQPETFDGIESVSIVAGGEVILRDDVSLTVTGSDAVDVVFLGAAGDNVALGGGDDAVHATAATLNGEDVLQGGDGIDMLVLEGGGLFDLNLPAGLDGFEWVSLDDGGVLILRDGATTTVFGSAGQDAVFLGTGEEYLDLGGGDDIVHATAAKLNAGDVLRGGTGTDTLILDGGGTFDLTASAQLDGFERVSLTGGGTLVLRPGGSLSVLGSNAQDVVVLGSGINSIDLSGGNDAVLATSWTLNAGDGLQGGTGDDTLSLTGGGVFDLRSLARFDGFEHVSLAGGGILMLRDDVDVEVVGSTAQDIVVLGSGSDNLDLGGGDDSVHATSATLAGDVLRGGAGSDTLYLDGGGIFDLSTLGGLSGFEHIVLADQGSTVILGAQTLAIEVEGGIGTDTLYLRGGGTFDLSTLGGLSGFERIALADEDSTVILGGEPSTIEVHGGAGNDRLIGGAGDDDMHGGSGDDLLHGGTGMDILNGGTGFDVVSYAGSSAGVQINLATGLATRGDAAGDVLVDIEGLIGSDHTDVLVGDSTANSLSGQGGNDSLNGRAGDDTMFGGDGNDALTGLTGTDRMAGGNGDDVITGGAARDFLSGDAGADRFVFATKDSGAAATTRDVISDFSQAGHDQIDLSGMTSLHFVGTDAFSYSVGELRYAIAGGFTLIEGDANGDGRADFQIEVSGTVHFTAADFVL